MYIKINTPSPPGDGRIFTYFWENSSLYDGIFVCLLQITLEIHKYKVARYLHVPAVQIPATRVSAARFEELECGHCGSFWVILASYRLLVTVAGLKAEAVCKILLHTAAAARKCLAIFMSIQVYVIF